MGLIGPWQNALEGAMAAVCAVAAMVAVAAVALWLLGASSIGSVWSLTMAVTAMAVGGSVNSGAETPGGTGGVFGAGGGLGPSVSGAAEAVPLGVTLVGTVVLWAVFSRRLRVQNQRRFTAGELAVRAASSVSTALFTLVITAGLAHGTVKMPASAMKKVGRMGGGQSAGDLGSGSGNGSGNPWGDLFGGGGNGSPLGGGLLGGGTDSQPSLTYHVSAMATGFGAALWVGAVLAVGCLISRRVRLPLGGALDRLRLTWAPSLSAVVHTILVLAAVPLVALTFVGAVVGGRAGTAAGATLLLAPNAMAVFLSLGVGASWTAAVHPVQSDGSNPLAGLTRSMSGTQGGQQPDRSVDLGSLAVGGWPLWLAALTVTGIVLLGCAYLAARATNPSQMVPLHPCRGPLPRHLCMAERFGLGTAVILGMVAWLSGLSGNFAISIFGSEMGGMRAELSDGVLWTAVVGLLVGGLTGFAGSLLSRAYGAWKTT
ncbi:streptophobe family protein [Streptomyces mirabilis]|uniref:streptophobe family protein n=1 Tax=Streptomyces mirabilis TaxID=68239 RepID=UPI00368FF88F